MRLRFRAEVVSVFLLVACGSESPCESFTDCGTDEVCVLASPSVDGEPTPDLVCLPSSVCVSRDDLREGFGADKCVPDSATCAGDALLSVCTDQLSSGCYVPESEPTECPTGTGCLGDEAEATCESTCTADAACDASEVCAMTAGSSSLFCGPETAGPTADTMCAVTLESAVLPERNGNVTWDFSGLPDPIGTIRYTSGDRWRTVAIQETLEPQWNATAPAVPYSEVAGMRVDIVDEDDPIDFGDGFEISNEDDFAAAYLPEGGRWFMDGQLSVSTTEEWEPSDFPGAIVSIRLTLDCALGG